MNQNQPAGALSSLKEGELTTATVNGVRVVLYLVDGKPYCTEDICTHEECFISESGWIEGDQVVCGCHEAKFSIKTGEVTAPPAHEPLRTFAVRVDNDSLYVDIPRA